MSLNTSYLFIIIAETEMNKGYHPHEVKTNTTYHLSKFLQI